MQRPRNRQGRGASQIDRVRGRGRGRGRGGDRNDSRGPSNTGREVQGVVADVLTNGNHPRGIKVRLVDGRVGRVQRMATEQDAKTGSDGLNGLGRNGEQGGDRYLRATGHIPHRDVREEEEMSIPAAGYSLGDLLPAGHPLREEVPLSGSGTSGPLSTCPVCGEFEGDEVAVSHHVNSHFE